MDIIHVLDKQISDLIAAGEVVERPASVVKELVENAIDAGATNIKIEIDKGGISLIRITDNGKGMTATDAETAFLKHATSKLHSKNDLYSINTLGFRGEALCAISAVSKITLKTKTADDIEGTYLRLDFGKISDKKTIAYINGTSITVENLFENTPARLKFLKSEAAETSAISSLVSTLALANPGIAFSYTVNGKEKMFTYGKGELKDAVLSIEGREFAENMIPVSISTPYGNAGKRITVNGFIGKPLYNRPSRSKQLFYINNRMIRSKIMQNALENGYKSYIMSGRFPVCIINLTVPYDEVDINVHPGKLEAKFGDERAIYDAILSAVTFALNKDRSSAPEMKFAAQKAVITGTVPSTRTPIKTEPIVEQKQEPTVTSSRKEELERLISKFEKRIDNSAVKKYDDWTIFPQKTTDTEKTSPTSAEEKRSTEIPSFSDSVKSAAEPIIFQNIIITPPETKIVAEPVITAENNLEEQTARPLVDDIQNNVLADEKPLSHEELQPKLSEDFGPVYKFIGECFHTYIILEGENELYIIDKHALHERMNFEKLKKERTHESQMLLTPIIVSLDTDKSASVVSRKDFLFELGFEVDEFGDDTVAIRAIPSILNRVQAENVICNFADTLTDNKAFVDAELLDEFLYDIACKASIRAGSESSDTELKALADEYMKNRDTLSFCPHGRPVMMTMTKNNIEKNFKRLV